VVNGARPRDLRPPDPWASIDRATVDGRGRVGSALDEARRAGVSDEELVELVANVALTIGVGRDRGSCRPFGGPATRPGGCRSTTS
jgi:hypothetical protein